MKKTAAYISLAILLFADSFVLHKKTALDERKVFLKNELVRIEEESACIQYLAAHSRAAANTPCPFEPLVAKDSARAK
jgi:hypothetical protein